MVSNCDYIRFALSTRHWGHVCIVQTMYLLAIYKLIYLYARSGFSEEIIHHALRMQSLVKYRGRFTYWVKINQNNCMIKISMCWYFEYGNLVLHIKTNFFSKMGSLLRYHQLVIFFWRCTWRLQKKKSRRLMHSGTFSGFKKPVFGWFLKSRWLEIKILP